MRRILAVVSWLCCLVAAPAAHASATLVEAGEPQFPARAWILTLPQGDRIAADDVDVSENGEDVSGLRVRPANVGGGFGVVLAIDTSKSMTGAPIRDAMSAAREFARQRPPAQKLGVVTFNERSAVLLRPTTDPAAIDAALASAPALAPGTHLYDGAAEAVRMLHRSGQDAGAVVVLSDGADRGSSSTPEQVAAAARRARARVFTVSAGSVEAGIPALRQMSELSSGAFLGAAKGNELVSVYRKLGAELASAYLISYRSLAPEARRVRVLARAGGERARAAYRAPELAVAGASKPSSEPFLATDAGIAIACLAVLLAAVMIIWHLFSVGSGGGGVRERVRRYGLPGGAAGSIDTAVATGPGEQSRGGSRASAARGSLSEQLEIARIGLSADAYIWLWLGGGVLLALFAVAVGGTLLLAPIAIVATFFSAKAFLSARVERQRKRFADQLPDSLQAVASAMRTGHSFAGALALLVDEAPEPAATEFGRVVADERLGVPLEDAFEHTIRRMDCRDLEQVALVAILQRETGGNGAEALDRVVENLRGREEIRRLVRTLTAQGRLSRIVLTCLPIGLLVALGALGGGYVSPLFETTTGNILLALGVGLVATGSVVIGRLIRIKV